MVIFRWLYFYLINRRQPLLISNSNFMAELFDPNCWPMGALWNSWTSSHTLEVASHLLKNDINEWLAKVWTTIDRLSIVWKLELSNKIKRNFYQAVMSILPYRCTSSMTKHIEKKLDENCTRMLQAILNKSWKLHPTKQHLYSHLSPIPKTIKIRWTKHSGHC